MSKSIPCYLKWLTLSLSLGVTPANITINDISLKLDYVAYISAAESTGVSSTTFT